MTSERERGPLLLVLALTALVALIGIVWVNERALVSPAQLWSEHLAAIFASNALNVFFLPGASPLGAALYAPFAAAGTELFGYVHTLVAVAAIPVVYAHARATSVRWPLLAALFVAASPSFLAAGPAGMPGSDGLLLVALGLYALEARRAPLVAGVLLGCAALIQLEVAAIGAGLAFIHRDDKRLVPAVAIPLLYLAVGAALHGMPWLGAALTVPGLAGPPAADGPAAIAITSLVAVLSACPAIGLLVLLFGDSQPPEQRSHLQLAGAFSVLVLVTGALDVGAVGLDPTRLLPALPLVAPALARGAAALADGQKAERAPVALLFLFVVAATISLSTTAIFPMQLTAACASVVVIARIAPRAFVFGLVAVALVGGVGSYRTSGLGTPDQEPGFAALTGLLETDPGFLADRRVATNVPIVAPLFRDGAAEVRFSFQGRVAEPLERSGGVRGREWLLTGHPFGDAIDPLVELDSLPPGTVLIVEGDRLRSRLSDSAALSILDDDAIAVFVAADAADAADAASETAPESTPEAP